MATLRIPALRNLLGRQSLPPLQRARAQQRRWAQVHDVRFLATTQQVSRSVHEKYREKLDRKAREAGVKDVSELKEVYRDRIQELKKKDNVSIPGLDALLADEPAPTTTTTPAQTTMSPDGLSQTPPPPPRPQGAQQPGKTGAAAIKPLSEILDLPKARELPEKELSAIWRLRHASDPRSVCAVVPAETYKVMRQTARTHPSFVLPVPRGEGVGAEIHFLQWVFTRDPSDDGAETATVLFTQLAEYKARGEFAQPHTSVTHHWDSGLAEKAGVVLMSGSVVEGRGASVADAQWLVMLLQRYYVDGEAGAKRALLNQFSKGDPTFSVEKLLEESEKFI